MKDTQEEKFNWKNAPEAALVKVMVISDAAVVLVFRQPDGSWSAEMRIRPVGDLKSVSEAMTVGEALARQWKRGLV